ncbi:MAG: helix-turn-helix domain-containing protein [Phycisphaerales bacterium]|nr:helix-turn-helix domain-containing protein [Phycisphaerales bacterium]
MAKMFYTLEEAASRLGKSEDEVREMAKTGQLQEFRDREKLMFKIEQIDLLTGGDEDTGDSVLDLDAPGGSGLDLAATSDSGLGLTGGEAPGGSGMGLSGSDIGGGQGASGGSSMMDLSGAGASNAETDFGSLSDQEDPSGGTQVGAAFEELSLEAVGSGSGLLDLTRESDDTSLGAELLEEVYSSEDDQVEIPANASGLFEAAGTDSATEHLRATEMNQMAYVPEVYDGVGSGWSAGLLIGGLVALVLVAICSILMLSGTTPKLAIPFADGLWIWTLGLVGIAVVLAIIGGFAGRASE